MKYVAVAFLLLAMGCASALGLGYHVSSRTDAYDGYKSVRMDGNYLCGSTSEGCGGMVELDVSRFEAEGRSLLSLHVSYSADDWIFLGTEEPLGIKIDGEEIRLEPDDSAPRQDVINGGSILEQQHFDVTPEVLDRVAGARTVLVQIVGQHGFATRSFSPANFEHLRSFLQLHVPESSLYRSASAP